MDDPTERAQRNAAIKEADRIREDSIISAKSHFEAAVIWRWWHVAIGLPAAVVAAASGVSTINDYSGTAALLAFSAAALAAVSTFLNPRENNAAHLGAGNAYKGLSNDARILKEIEAPSMGTMELVAGIKSLNERRNKLNEESPPIPRRAFERARKGIEGGEATYAIDQRKKPS